GRGRVPPRPVRFRDRVPVAQPRGRTAGGGRPLHDAGHPDPRGPGGDGLRRDHWDGTGAAWRGDPAAMRPDLGPGRLHPLLTEPVVVLKWEGKLVQGVRCTWPGIQNGPRSSAIRRRWT